MCWVGYWSAAVASSALTRSSEVSPTDPQSDWPAPVKSTGGRYLNGLPSGRFRTRLHDFFELEGGGVLEGEGIRNSGDGTSPLLTRTPNGFSGAEIGGAAKCAARNSFGNAGQVCVATERIFVLYWGAP